MKGIMIQGTASDVGKSLVATALCRLFANEGWKVAPFKSQNMSNNSYVTIMGEEIGRAQGIQAEAAKTEAVVWMNPILLKPRSDQHSEIVLMGKVFDTMSGKGYRDHFYEQGIEAIQTSLAYLDQHYDVVVMEGAGSPVEINLRERELVNMKVAEMADVPVVLVADIDRGGVFASIIGTLELLSPSERRRVRGLIINKFRGEISLFTDGIRWLEEKTGIPVLGVLPYLSHHGIEGEDSLSLQNRMSNNHEGGLDIAIIHLPYVSNYSDIEPFDYEKDVSIRWVKHGSEFGNPDAIILPGTKSTINDLQYLKHVDLVDSIKHFTENSGHIIGICGGYQLLGESIIDVAGTDTGCKGKQVDAIGVIPAQTVFQPVKETIRVKGVVIKGNIHVEGYEIHLGETIHLDGNHSFIQLADGRVEGYCSNDGAVIGTYMHHLFHNDVWRNEWLNRIRAQKGLQTKKPFHAADMKEARYEALAAQLKANLDWEQLKTILFDEVIV